MGKIIFVTPQFKASNDQGNEIAKLVNDELPAGNYEVEFSTSDAGGELSSGIYFYQLHTGEFFETKKMTLLK